MTKLSEVIYDFLAARMALAVASYKTPRTSLSVRKLRNGLAVVGLTYAAFAFGHWSLDPATWDPILRGACALLGLYVGGMAYAFTEKAHP